MRLSRLVTCYIVTASLNPLLSERQKEVEDEEYGVKIFCVTLKNQWQHSFVSASQQVCTRNKFSGRFYTGYASINNDSGLCHVIRYIIYKHFDL